jgi:hypothetical protein
MLWISVNLAGIEKDNNKKTTKGEKKGRKNVQK